ncbi:MAG: glycosyltransferase family 4 protein [Anaerolineae bacterium]|nr:glycosyltransferase family 4 protein [Anaerolineae bacterium]
MKMDGQPVSRILMVIDNLSTGGAQRQMVNLAVGLKVRGYQPAIFCYAPGEWLAEPLIKAGIPIHRHMKNSRYSTDVVFALSNLVKAQKFDLLISFMTTPNTYALLASLLSLPKRPRVIVSERFTDLPGQVSRLERLARSLYRFSDAVVTNAHHQQRWLTQHVPGLNGRLLTIYNGYDLATFRPAANEPDNHPLRLLAIASVSRYKNGLCLVEALGILREQYGLYPTVDWIGQRVLSGDRLVYLGEMDRAIQSHGLLGQWRWLDQRLDIVDQLQSHDVLVHPSYGEGLPNVVCEALACARPVILSNVLDHPLLVQDGVSGMLFDPQNPTDLAEKIAQFAALPVDERARMGRQGRAFAEANLSQERFVDEYERLMTQIRMRKNR